MAEALIVRKHKDGRISVKTGSGNPLPNEHGFTPRFLGGLKEQGLGTLHLTLETEDGAVVYEIVGVNRADEDNDESPIIEFRGELIETPQGDSKRRRKK